MHVQSQTAILNLYRQFLHPLQSKKTNIDNRSMNPFEKLKLTIDRIGLQYIPSNDNQTFTGDTVYKYSNTNQVEQNQSLPYFKTQGQNQQSFKKQSEEFRAQEIEQLKTVFQNQHKNLVQQINSLNQKFNELQTKYQIKSLQNDQLNSELDSSFRQNQQLKAYILELQNKNARKMSESGVIDRERKFKEEIDRVNFTVTDLAKDLNSQKSTRKNLQKQLQQSRLQFQQKQQKILEQKYRLERQIELLKQELQNRAQLLEHSIKSSRDNKIEQRKQLSEVKQKYEIKIESIQVLLQKARQQIYNLKNQATGLRFERESLKKEREKQLQANDSINNELQEYKQIITTLTEKEKDANNKLHQLRLQVAYYQQQLEEERSNTKVKVVEVRDESLEMELTMYKKQCKQLMKERSISQSVRKQKSEYTIISENQVLLNSRSS